MNNNHSVTQNGPETSDRPKQHNDNIARMLECEKIVKQSPMNVTAQLDLAKACLATGDKSKAERLFGLVGKLDPTHKESRQLLIGLLLNANSARKAGPIAAELIALDDKDPESIRLLAFVEFGIGKWGHVVENCEAAINASSDKFTMKKRVLPCYVHCADIPDAEKMVNDVIQTDPNERVGINALGSLYFRKGEFEAAIQHFQKYTKDFPDDLGMKAGLGFHQLAHGDLENGLSNFSERLMKKFFDSTDDIQRLEHIDQIEGEPVFIIAEQGIGDIFQFLRFIPHVQKYASHVYLNLRNSLHGIVQYSFPDITIQESLSDLPDCKFAVPLMGLPKVLNITDFQDLRSEPYLKFEPELAERWRAKIGTDGFKIGLCWQGNPKGLVDFGRSIPLKDFEAISKIDGVRLISLQHGFGEEQIGSNPDLNIEELADVDAEKDRAFFDTAAIMSCLDLVVTTDTSTAHIAGALGCPVALLTKKFPDWRWNLGGNGDVWYDGLQLFPQEVSGSWDAAIRNVVETIEQRIQSAKSKN